MDTYFEIEGDHFSFHSNGTWDASIIKYTSKNAYGCGYGLNIESLYIGLDEINRIVLWDGDNYQTIYVRDYEEDLTRGTIKHP